MIHDRLMMYVNQAIPVIKHNKCYWEKLCIQYLGFSG